MRVLLPFFLFLPVAIGIGTTLYEETPLGTRLLQALSEREDGSSPVVRRTLTRVQEASTRRLDRSLGVQATSTRRAEALQYASDRRLNTAYAQLPDAATRSKGATKESGAKESGTVSVVTVKPTDGASVSA